jgi:hypothetical protein
VYLATNLSSFYWHFLPIPARHIHKRKISKEYAENYIDNLKMYISEEEYLTAIEEVLKWAK